MVLVVGVWTFVRALLFGSAAIALENLALRHQLLVLQRSGRRPRLTRRLARENPTWGRRRIQADLAVLGYEVAELAVAKYMRRASPRPSPTARVFLASQARALVAVDLLLLATLTYLPLCAFVIFRHDRRDLVPINVTDQPTAAWTARQLVEAFPDAMNRAAEKVAP